MLDGELEQRRVVERRRPAVDQRPGQHQAADDGRRGRAQAPGVRDGVAAGEPQPRRLSAQGVEGPAHRAHHEVVLVEGYDAGAGAGHLDDEAGAGQLALELVAQVEGEAERVEAGTQVRRGRRDTRP